MWIVYNEASGAVLGSYPGASEEEAIAAMLADAGEQEPAGPDLRPLLEAEVAPQK